jgi:hypothetical protein
MDGTREKQALPAIRQMIIYGRLMIIYVCGHPGPPPVAATVCYSN